MGYSSDEIFGFLADRHQFQKWAESDQESTEANFVSHTKRAVIVAIDRELSETQKRYFLMYFLEGKTIQQIADVCGVNKSTVSRVLATSRKRLADVVRYSSPQLMNASGTTRNRRVK